MGLLNQLFSGMSEHSGRFQDFVFGVEDTFRLKDSDDLIVVGRVKGTIHTGSPVYINNWSDGENPVTMSKVKAIEISHRSSNEAENCFASLRLGKAASSGIRIGTVLAGGNASSEDIRSAYITAIGNAYIEMRHLDLTDRDLEGMSITDMSEAWRLYLAACRHGRRVFQDDQQTQRNKMNRLAERMKEKILSLDEMYIAYSAATGEPYLFAEIIDSHDGTYRCLPPEVMMVTKPYVRFFEENAGEDHFVIRSVSKGENGNGIRNFFETAFYQNGACALRINSREVGIAAGQIMAPPSYDNVPDISVPVTNPDLMRWILLMGQMGRPESEEADKVYRIYDRQFLKELPEARFLIPVKSDSPAEPPEEDGKTVLKQDTSITLSTIEGKEGREAVRMYTDWRMLRQEYGEEWSGLIMPVSGIIDMMDCAVNVTDHPAAGVYVDREAWQRATELERSAE